MTSIAPIKKPTTRIRARKPRSDQGAPKLVRENAKFPDLVNPQILRTAFLTKEGPHTSYKSILGKTVALPFDSHELHAKAVTKLPRRPVVGSVYILLNDKQTKSLSMHNLVKFPAKLHPPFVEWAIDQYTKEGDTILDPFCGCGTVVLEATLKGRKAIGFDVDPYSAFIANAKCNPPTMAALEKVIMRVRSSVDRVERPSAVYKRLAKSDISKSYYRKQIAEFSVPSIPNVNHWFKHYVLVDLVKIWGKLRNRRDQPRLERYLRVAFASILRLCSNADPDTLSGLEVTKRMRAWMERGRHINPIAMFSSRLNRNADPILERFWTRAESLQTRHAPRIRTCSALDGRSYRGTRGMVDAIITSPPYCSAVEYSRRHLLEHYWLGFVNSATGAAKLRRQYVGRKNYIYGNPTVLLNRLPGLAREMLAGYLGPIPTKQNARVRAILGYFLEMAKWLKLASDQLKPGGHLVLVIGDSTVKGRPIGTAQLLKELAPSDLKLKTQFSYVLRNRSMQYSRWNHADVATEKVMVFTKAGSVSKNQRGRIG